MADDAAAQRDQEPLRCSDPNPIAGRSGMGAPFCPPGWKWRTGNRVQDMYFTAPSGERFRSKNELKAYVDKAPNPPDMTQFVWRVPADMLKDGPLPGDSVQSQARGTPSKRGLWRGGSRRGGRKRKAVELRDPKVSDEDLEQSKLSKLKDVARKTLMVSTEFSSEPKIEPQAFTSLPFLPPERATAEVVPVKRKRGRPPKNKNVLQQLHPTDSKATDPPPVKRKRGRPPASVDDHTFTAVLSTVTSYKWLHDASEGLRRFMEEAGRLGQKTDQELAEFRKLLLARCHDTVSMKRYSNPVLHVFVRILRNQEAPEDLGRTALADLCCNWKCKHKRHICLLEEGRIQALVTASVDNEALSSGNGEPESRPGEPAETELPGVQLLNGSPQPASGHAGTGLNGLLEPVGKNETVDEQSIAKAAMSDRATSHGRRPRAAASPSLNVCICKACSNEAEFCRGCMCNLCSEAASPLEEWRVVKCIGCQHLFHVHCAISHKHAGVVKESGLDVEFECPLCNCKMDLFPFWRARLDGAIASKDVEVLEKEVASAVLVLKGTQRRQYVPLHDQMVQAFNILLGRTNYPEVYRLLQQIEQQLEALGVNQLTTGESNVSVADLQQRERDLLDMEVRVSQVQKMVDAHHQEWSEADRIVKASRANFEKAQEELRLATEAARLKSDQASSSRQLVQKEKHSMTLLREKVEPVAFSPVELEAKHGVLEDETAESQMLEKKVRCLDAIADEFEIASLLEKIGNQEIRVRVARGMYEKLLVLGSIDQH